VSAMVSGNDAIATLEERLACLTDDLCSAFDCVARLRNATDECLDSLHESLVKRLERPDHRQAHLPSQYWPPLVRKLLEQTRQELSRTKQLLGEREKCMSDLAATRGR
jgi:hypothetical protein